ncbi:MAG: hypothetical protein E7504_01500 [Ruminococcus sp.]|nr:hypothetical protein [Ruminococcus sp.]
MNFKKVMAAVAAMSLVACAAAIPASASADGATVEIQQVEVDVKDLAKDGGNVIPVAITLTENKGINAFAFGVDVDDACEFEMDYDVQTMMMTIEGAKSEVETENFAWINGASTRTYSKTDVVIIGLTVTIPKDAKVGDVFELNYADVDLEGKDHIWGDTTTKADYVADKTADAVDGWIKIVGEEETTPDTTPETTPDTTPETTPDTTPETTPDTTPETTPDTTPDTTTTTTTTTTGTSTSTTPGTGSPATGTTDVLPIVGVAAAAAILGGVAIVAKKKED